MVTTLQRLQLVGSVGKLSLKVLTFLEELKHK